MKEYHKIQGVFKRDINNPDKSKRKRFLMGEFTLPEFEMLKDIEWEFTEKVDGTNIRVMVDKNWSVRETEDGKTEHNIGQESMPNLTFGGRTNRAQIPKHLFEYLETTFTLDKMSSYFEDFFSSDGIGHITLYGEGYGSKIQKGGGDYFPNDPKGVGFILFDVKIGHSWLRRESVESIAEKLEIPVVPLIGYGTLEEGIKMATDGFDSKLRSTPPEGLIAKPRHGLLDNRGKRIITKLKLCDFQER